MRQHPTPARHARTTLAALATSVTASVLVSGIAAVARRRARRQTPLPDLLTHPGTDDDPTRVLLGRCADGTRADLCFGYTKPHALVVGPTGTGKSVVVRNFLTHALAHPEHWNVIGIDYKIVDFAWLKAHDTATVVSSFEDTISVLEATLADMQALYAQMETEGVPNAHRLASRPKATMIVLDEAGFLAPEHRDDPYAAATNAQRARIVHLLTQIGRLGRGTNVHLVIATQCVDVDRVLGGELFSNLSTRIAMDASDAALSCRLFNHDYTTRPPRVRGRGIIGTHGVADVFQSYYIPPGPHETDSHETDSNEVDSHGS